MEPGSTGWGSAGSAFGGEASWGWGSTGSAFGGLGLSAGSAFGGEASWGWGSTGSAFGGGVVRAGVRRAGVRRARPSAAGRRGAGVRRARPSAARRRGVGAIAGLGFGGLGLRRRGVVRDSDAVGLCEGSEGVGGFRPLEQPLESHAFSLYPVFRGL